LDLLSRCRNQGKCHPVCPQESNTDVLVSSFSKSLSIYSVVP
jgi:succinate dehydrogenase/fumarate reductase-like Fe-S protein